MFRGLKKLWSRVGQKNIGSCAVSTGGQQSIGIQSGSFLSFALGNAGGFYHLTDQRAMSLYGQSSALATAVDIILQEFASIKPVLRSPDGTLDDSHEILDLLSNPNDYNETWAFMATNIGLHYLLTGDSHIYLSGNVNLKPLEMYSIKPQDTSVIEGEDKYPFYYSINEGPGASSQYLKNRTKTGFRYYTNDNMRELFHIRRQNAGSERLHGDSPLKAICLDVEQQIKGRLHNSKLLDNGARPSMLAIFKDTMTQDQHDERRKGLNEQMAGADNAGKIAVTSSNDLDIKELGLTNKDMDYAELEKMADRAVYNRYRIPLPLVTNEAATNNNMGHSVENLYDFAVLPVANVIFKGLSMALMPRFKMDPAKYEITYNPYEIGALKSRMIRELKERKDIGIESINELREGLPNRDDVEGGNDILVDANKIPIGEVRIIQDEQDMTPEQEADALIQRDGE